MGNFQTIPLHWQDGSEKHTSRHFKCPNSELWKDPIQPLSAQMFFIFLLFEQFFLQQHDTKTKSKHFNQAIIFVAGCALCTTWQSSTGQRHFHIHFPGPFGPTWLCVGPFPWLFPGECFCAKSRGPYFFSGSRQGIATPHLHPKWWWKVGKESLLYQVLRTSSWGEWNFFGKHFHEIAWNIPN